MTCPLRQLGLGISTSKHGYKCPLCRKLFSFFFRFTVSGLGTVALIELALVVAGVGICVGNQLDQAKSIQAEQEKQEAADAGLEADGCARE